MDKFFFNIYLFESANEVSNSFFIRSFIKSAVALYLRLAAKFGRTQNRRRLRHRAHCNATLTGLSKITVAAHIHQKSSQKLIGYV